MSTSQEVVYVGNINDKITVDIPDFFGNKTLHEVVWLRPIRDSFIEVSLRSKETDSFTIWLCQQVNNCILPISCTMYIESDEEDIHKLLKSLNVSLEVTMNKIIDNRISLCMKQIM